MLRIIDRVCERGYSIKFRSVLCHFLVLFASLGLYAVTNYAIAAEVVMILAFAGVILGDLVPMFTFLVYRILTDMDKVSYLPFEADDEE